MPKPDKHSNSPPSSPGTKLMLFNQSGKLCPKTHTFHLSWGESTITLQDVAYHLGLRAYGKLVGDATVISTDGTVLRHGSSWSDYLVPGLQWFSSKELRERSLSR
ncbi:hypothetical protein Ahy_B03g066426 [Arachis hypogaea]|uniref:Aminotransferase-like plant mobile domain-containing protein n=1 Tax=Arachis hypogaea TaxID=3818 RepID=A0A445A3Y7_ARAHY|nr:hypothetical protein Ahy_B03g066426 [Arachis hypogaea]